MAQSLYIPVVLLAAVLGMVVAFVAWVGGDRTDTRLLTVFAVLGSFWAVTEGLSVAAADLGVIRLWTQVGLSLSAIIPVVWLLLVVAYTGSERRLTRRLLVVLLVEPGVFSFLVWTAAEHDLVWTEGGSVGAFSSFVMEFGLAFWAHQAYSYLLVAAGGLLLVRTSLQSTDIYRSQSTALLAAIVVPMVGNGLYLFGVVPNGINPAALGYVVSSVILAVAMVHTELLRLTPAVRELGREELLAELDDSIFMLDEEGRIVDTNPAAAALLEAPPEDVLGTRIAETLPTLAAKLDGADKTQLQLDLGGTVRYYDVRVSTIDRHYGTVAGTLVSLRDVTDQYQREQRLDVLNRVLRHNIRNELNIVRGNVDLAREDARGPVQDRLDTALGALDTVIDRSEKVGKLSRLFETDTGGQFDLAVHLRSDLPKVHSEYPHGSLRLSVPEQLPVAADPAVTAVFDELVGNAFQHHDGEHPQVAVGVDEAASDDRYVVVTVTDDGPGIGTQERRVIAEGRETPLEHGSGVGLWLANWVVERNGGALTIESTGDGTVASVRLPRAEGTGPEESDRSWANPRAEQTQPSVEL